MLTVTTEINCLRCGHKWIPRKPEVRCCPRCHSIYFDRPRKVDENEETSKTINSGKT